MGSLLAGAVTELPTGRGRMVNVTVSDVDALVAGLPHGGTARTLVVPATDLPPELWELLLARKPIGLVTRLDGKDVVATELLTTDIPAATVVSTDRVVTVLFPVTNVVIVGTGPMADAITAAASLLGWQTQTTNDVSTATGLIAGLAPLDKVVIAAHDIELAGPALVAALDSDAGYIGALGSQRMRLVRADWLAYRGVTDLARILSPAGFDIGADTPAKVAISILAEAIAVEAGRDLPRTLDPDDATVR